MRRALVLEIVADFDQHSINFHFEYNVIKEWILETISNLTEFATEYGMVALSRRGKVGGGKCGCRVED